MNNNYNPLVSIIIPVYNGANYLSEAIESAINQTYKNIEIIVVNDGSNDKGATREVALKYSNQIRYFEKENGGVASAFNHGIKRMKGEFFSWLSHDDVYMDYKIKVSVEKYFEIGDFDKVIYSDYYYVNDIGEIMLHKNDLKIPNKNILFLILTKVPLINGNTIFFKKKLFDEVGLFNESLQTSQDYDMWFKLAKKYPFFFTKNKLVKYRIHNEQGTKLTKQFSKNSSKMYFNNLQTLSESELLSITSSKNKVEAYFKFCCEYLRNGSNKNGWPFKETFYELIKFKKLSVLFYTINLFILFLKLKLIKYGKIFIKILTSKNIQNKKLIFKKENC